LGENGYMYTYDYLQCSPESITAFLISYIPIQNKKLFFKKKKKIALQWRHRCREQTYGHSGVSRRKERVGCMEKVAWKHTLPYVKQIANGNLLYDSRNSNQLGFCNNLEWWNGERGG